jgi:hypothetical protein
MLTKGQETAADVAALLRARNCLIWIVTREEERVERLLLEAAASAKFAPRTWDVAAGVVAMDGRTIDAGLRDPGDCLGFIETKIAPEGRARERAVTIMRDLPVWISGPQGASTLRRLRNLARAMPKAETDRAQAVIVLSPSAEVPPELSNHATVIEWPMPDRTEIGDILEAAVQVLPTEQALRATAGGIDAAIDAAVGLTGEEAASCFARSLVTTRTIDPKLIAKEKKRIIARERVLEWFDPLPGGLGAVGGLENLKSWLQARSGAYSAAAREYGLPAPKGAMLVGIPGCGKSLTAKAIATAWSCPLLKVDLGALKSKFVGESEQNLRKAFKVIEAIGRCVVWFDEIEKALQGSTSGSADGGVSADALGAVLNWMQERQGEAFVIATANKIDDLPPELLRKGRFDEIFFVDLPTPSERREILQAALRAHNRADAPIDLVAVASATEEFTGSEVAAIVPDALFMGFADNQREIQTSDLLAAAATVVPLAKTAEDKIKKLRDWAASGRARPASARFEAPTRAQTDARQLDLA